MCFRKVIHFLKCTTKFLLLTVLITFFFFCIYGFLSQTLNFLFCIGVQLTINVTVVSGEQQRESAIKCIHFLPNPSPSSNSNIGLIVLI